MFVIFVVLVFAPGASAPAAALSVSVTPQSGVPSRSLLIAGSGFSPGARVEAFVDSTDLASAVADGNGRVAIGLKIPTAAVAGNHWISVVDPTTGAGAQTSFLVRSSWPELGHDVAHTGFDATENVLDPTTVPSLQQQWTGETGGPVISSPAVSGSLVYVGSADDTLYAFSASGCGAPTCSPVWTGQTGGPVDSSPVVSNGVVYTGSGDGKLYAYNATCGVGGAICQPLWTGSTGNAIDSSPVVASGKVVVGSDDGKVYGFPAAGCGAATCVPSWSTQLGGAITSSPIVRGATVYIGTPGGDAVALNIASGARVWNAVTGGAISGSPALWSTPTPGSGSVLIGSGDEKLYDVAASCTPTQGTCTPRWSVNAGTALGSVATAYNTAYVGGRDGSFHAWSTLPCLNPKAAPCGPSWSTQTGGGIVDTPAIANGVVFVGSMDGSLYAFTARGLAPLWSAPLGGAVESSPAIANGQVYVGSDDGAMHVFGVSGFLAPKRPTLSSLTTLPVPIRHVVVLYQENHSFDNVFGPLCIQDSRCDGAASGQTSDGQTIPLSRAGDILPQEPHSTEATQQAIDGGRMDGFSLYPACTASTGYACYTAYDPSEIPNLAALARRFVISDRTFEFRAAASWGGHELLAAGDLDGFNGDNPPGRNRVGRPGWGCDSNKVAAWTSPTGVLQDEPSCIPRAGGSGPFEASPVAHIPTIMDRLDAAGYTWELYTGDYGEAGWISGYGWSICPTFADCLYGPEAQDMTAAQNVISDAQSGSLPNLSLVQPDGAHSQHNGDSMLEGDNWIGDVVSAIENGPDWNSTAIFITYDDCGCFYDHVPPPNGYGIRVPLVIVSPYARLGFTDSKVASQASILTYVENVFGVPPLGESDATAYGYGDSFDYSQTPVPGAPTVRTPVQETTRRYLRAHPPPVNDPT